MNKKLILGVTAIVVLAGLGYFVFKNSATESKSLPVTANETKDVTDTQAAETTSSAKPTAEARSSVKEFTVEGSNYKFSPSEIRVKKGDTVKITFKDDDGSHNLVIEGYNVKTNIIGPGSEDTVTFLADKSGSFKYFCSVGEHAELGMTGTFIVE